MVTVILVAAVALLAVAAIAWPFLHPHGGADVDAEPRPGPGVQLQDEIERSLRAIREIEFDHAAGNLGDADFDELMRAERARAAELIRRRDGVKG